MRTLFCIALIAAGSGLAAKEPLLNIPLDCNLGEDCYINDYFDRNQGAEVRDFMCGRMTRDGHSGVDFALPNLDVMDRGVQVIAAAPGRVVSVRDGVIDAPVVDPDDPALKGKECGNGVVVWHGGGWATQYCHLKQGSVAVRKGDRIRLRTPLGLVGMSGLTNYPHVHFTVYKEGVPVDPFHPSEDANCGIDVEKGLWQTQIPYVAGGILEAGFTTKPISLSEIRRGTDRPVNLPDNSPMLIGWVSLYSVQAGDEVSSKIIAPDGSEFVAQDAELGSDRNFHRLFLGKRKRDRPWSTGLYTLTVEMRRAGRVISTASSSIEVISP